MMWPRWNHLEPLLEGSGPCAPLCPAEGPFFHLYCVTPAHTRYLLLETLSSNSLDASRTPGGRSDHFKHQASLRLHPLLMRVGEADWKRLRQRFSEGVNLSRPGDEIQLSTSHLHLFNTSSSSSCCAFQPSPSLKKKKNMSAWFSPTSFHEAQHGSSVQTERSEPAWRKTCSSSALPLLIPAQQHLLSPPLLCFWQSHRFKHRDSFQTITYLPLDCRRHGNHYFRHNSHEDWKMVCFGYGPFDISSQMIASILISNVHPISSGLFQ